MRKTSLLAVIIVILISIIIYANSLLNGFVFDDMPQVVKNQWIIDFANIPQVFTSSAWSFLGDNTAFHYYRPMMHVIYTLEYHLFTLNPFFWHLVNIVFHAFNAVMVFFVASFVLGGSGAGGAGGGGGSAKGRARVLEDFPIFPFIAAVFFSVHPVTTEVVAWVAAIPELSYTAFFLLSLYLYMRATSSVDNEIGSDSGSGNFTILFRPAYIFSLLFFFLSLFCKEPAMMLILVLWAYDFFKGRRLFTLSAIVRYAPFVVLAVIYLAIRSHALGGLAPKFSEHAYLSTFQIILNVAPLVFKYFISLIFPMRFSPFYIFYPVFSLTETAALFSWVFVLISAALYLYLLKKRGPALFAVTLIIAPLLPALYIPAFVSSVFSVRYLYLPVAGFTILLAYGVRYFSLYLRANNERTTRAVGPLVAVLLVLFIISSIKVVQRNRVWRDNFSLWSETVALYPENYQAHLSLSSAYSKIGEVERAKESQRSSIKYNLALKYPKKHALAESWYNLGVLYYSTGDIDKAIDSYNAGLEVNVRPMLIRDLLNNLGNAYAEKGLIDEAISSYERALLIDPSDTYVRHNLEAVRKWKRR